MNYLRDILEQIFPIRPWKAPSDVHNERVKDTDREVLSEHSKDYVLR